MQNSILIAELRCKHHKTQQYLANKLNVSLYIYTLYETGLRDMSLKHLNFLANYYRVSLNSLLNLTDKVRSQNNKLEIDYNYLKFSLKFIRKRNKVTAVDIANEFNLAPSTISKYENNPEIVPINYIYLFAKKFNISIDYMCGKTLKKEILT